MSHTFSFNVAYLFTTFDIFSFIFNRPKYNFNMIHTGGNAPAPIAQSTTNKKVNMPFTKMSNIADIYKKVEPMVSSKDSSIIPFELLKHNKECKVCVCL